ncbi:lymphocyte antigen 6E [Haliaeetus albicilla]|uniref:lymphocyte antigen 6E n=1 Tax=Haliaeetus albicilla TaxID=8969 RepID=UPI0005225271|nr:PREDICTED: lymphocyte antigen 6E-like [Haliaeetus albicilla]
MKASLLALLALILCADQVNALYCYTCDWERSNWSCLKAKKCSDKDEYCVTNVASVGIGFLSLWKRITKKCSETCPHHNFSLGLASYTSYCCQTFLCNLSACPGPRLARQ